MDDDDNPCIGICTIEDGRCIGCGRTEEEIYGIAPPAPVPATGGEPARATLAAG